MSGSSVAGGLYEATPSTYTDGQIAPAHIDSAGNLKVAVVAGTANVGDIDVLTLPNRGYGARVSIIRPSDTTTYTAGDVVGVTGGGTGCITFPTMAAAAGDILITSARFQRNATALISGETNYTLHLFNIAQPGAQVDNAVFDIAAGDQASYLGKISLGTPIDEGSTLHCEVSGINKQITLASTSLFGVLVTEGSYQPASAAVHIVELHSRVL
jgi:hypothetical protein